MEMVIAKLYKSINKEGSENLSEDMLFTLMGHFDYLQFETIGVEEKNDLSGLEARLGEVKKGYETQSLCLFTWESTLEILSDSLDEEYPFCVLAMLEDNEHWVTLDGTHFDVFHDYDAAKEDMKLQLDRYQDWLKEFLGKGGEGYQGAKVKMQAFHTLSCMDTVLVIRTNCVPITHRFVYYLTQTQKIITSYSAVGMVNSIITEKEKLEKLADLNKGLRLSIRMVFRINEAASTNVEDIKGTFEKNGIECEALSLTGNHQYLLHVSERICRALYYLFSEKEAIQEKRKILSVCRTTLCYKTEVLDGIQSNEYGDYPACQREIGYIIDELQNYFEEMQEQLDDLKSSRGNAYVLERTRQYAKAVKLVLQQELGFLRYLDNQGREGINPELCVAVAPIIKTLRNLSKESNQCFIEHIKERDLSDKLYWINFYIQQLNSSVEILCKTILNMVHMQRNQIEERGLFQNELAATAKLTLGYMGYANRLYKQLLKTENETENGEEVSEERSYAFIVSQEAMDDKVTATEKFEYLQTFKQSIGELPENSLIHIKIAQHFIFKFREVQTAITHEVAHFVGYRDRKTRAECILKSVVKWLARQLMPRIRSLTCDDGTGNKKIRKSFMKFFENRKKQLDTIYLEQIQKLEDMIVSVSYQTLKQEFGENLEWAYQELLEEKLPQILNHLLQNKVTLPNGDEAYIPIAVAEAHLSYRRELNKQFYEWYRKLSLDPSQKEEELLRLAFIGAQGFVKEPYMMAGEIVKSSVRRINNLFNDDYYESSAFVGVSFDGSGFNYKKCCEEEWKNTLTIQQIVKIFCYVYSEVYCDYIATEWLGLAKKEYMEYVWYADKVTQQDNWRVYTILRLVYKEIDHDREDGSGGLINFNEEIENYFNAIRKNKAIKELLEKKQCFANANTVEIQPFSEFIYLYQCYSSLLRESASDWKEDEQNDL